MEEFSEFGYLYVLDYSNSDIYEIILDEQDDNISTEDILRRRSLDMDECSFMFTSSRIDNISQLKPNEDVI